MNAIVNSDSKSREADGGVTDSRADSSKPSPSAPSLGVYLRVLLLGMFLGIVFVKSEVATWHRIHNMFLFQEAHLYLIISLAIIVAMVSMLLIKRFGVKSLAGKPIQYEPKPFTKGAVLGGMLFGAGWAITGACPGPIYAQIGGGEVFAWFTFAGALLGMFCYAWLKPKLP